MTKPMETLWAGRIAPVTLGERIGLGRQGAVYGVRGEPHLAVKLRTPDRDFALDEYLRRARAEEWLDEHHEPRLTWPIAPVHDDSGRPRGYVMLRLDQEIWTRADDYLSSRDRADVRRSWTWERLLLACVRLATLVDDVHGRSIAIVDLSAANVMFSIEGRVALVDCDDMVFLPVDENEPPLVVQARRYAPPERLVDGRPAVPTRHTDAWALGTLICELLLDGSHPFDGQVGDSDDATGVEGNVLNGTTRFRKWRRGPKFEVDPISLDVLPPDVLKLARRAFVDGHRKPMERPSAKQWRHALERVKCVRCPTSRQHVYPDHLRDCPWCERVAAGHPDPFPPPPAVPPPVR